MTACSTAVTEKPKYLPLDVLIRKEPNGAVLLSRPLSKSELAEFAAEAWHRVFLRGGFADVPLHCVPIKMLPTYSTGMTAGPLAGFTIHTVNPAGRKIQVDFTKHAVGQTALELAQQLIASGDLRLGDNYFYELLLGKADKQAVPSGPQVGCRATITTEAAPLRYLCVDLAPLLRVSKAIGPHSEHLGQVFYTEKAFQSAERFSRQGGNQQPPVETGCMLVGTLCACPKTGEFFCVVTDVLEARDAQSRKLSLEFTGQTWNRIETIVRAKQAQPASATQRLLGQAHGHPFLPLDGAPPCDVCWQKKECPRTSCFVSLDDRTWSRAVFPRQPWQLCHIFGLNARGDYVNKLFGQHNGNLNERGYRVLPEFNLQTAAVGDPHHEG